MSFTARLSQKLSCSLTQLAALLQRLSTVMMGRRTLLVVCTTTKNSWTGRCSITCSRLSLTRTQFLLRCTVLVRSAQLQRLSLAGAPGLVVLRALSSQLHCAASRRHWDAGASTPTMLEPNNPSVNSKFSAQRDVLLCYIFFYERHSFSLRNFSRYLILVKSFLTNQTWGKKYLIFLLLVFCFSATL